MHTTHKEDLKCSRARGKKGNGIYPQRCHSQSSIAEVEQDTGKWKKKGSQEWEGPSRVACILEGEMGSQLACSVS